MHFIASLYIVALILQLEVLLIGCLSIHNLAKVLGLPIRDSTTTNKKHNLCI